MLLTLNYQRVSHNSLLNLCNLIITIFTEYLQPLPFLAPFLDILKVKMTYYETAFARQQKNPYLLKKDEADRLRIELYKSLRKFLESCQTLNVPEVEAAALILLEVFRKNGWSIQKFGHKDRTGAIRLVIAEIKSKYMTEITTVGAETILTALTDAEDKYEASDKTAVDHVLEKTEPTITDARTELIIAIRNALKAVELQSVISPGIEIENMISQLSEVIASTSASAKAAVTRAENIKNKEEENPDKPKEENMPTA